MERRRLSQFTFYWDTAALETLGSEFDMMDLLSAQLITNIDGSSILDYVVFDGGIEVNLPQNLTNEVKYFKAPWDN